MHEHPYRRLAAMAALSFIAMYVLMYAMVDSLRNVYPNINQFYMAALMTAPMVAIELVVMRAMYPRRAVNAVVAMLAVIALIAFFALIRFQSAVSDKEFLKSMIPHHAGAILMCERASIRDAEISALCKEIVAGQQREIDQMKRKLEMLRG